MRIKWLKELLIFIIFGCCYLLFEIMWRGYTHWTMFIVGGLCGFLIGLINEKNKEMPLIKQCLISTLIVTVIEFISGFIIKTKILFSYFSSEPIINFDN